MQTIYSQTHHINVNSQVYQLQRLDTPEQTFFLVKRSGELLNIITKNKRGQWQADDPISKEQLAEIIKWIEKLFNLYNR
jgi:hypothetical protein